MVLMLFCGSLVVWQTHNWKFFAFCVGTDVFIFVFGRLCLRDGLQDLVNSGRTWVLGEEGLRRVYPSGKSETIRWEQIRHMVWRRYNGLIIRWEEPEKEYHHRSNTFRTEFPWDWVYRQGHVVLRVQQDEALELLSVAEQKTGLSYEKLAA